MKDRRFTKISSMVGLTLLCAACEASGPAGRRLAEGHEDGRNLEQCDPDDMSCIAPMFEEQAEQIAASVATNGDGLPLWQSRPGANIALFVDYDGGYYSSSNPESDGYYSPASLDSDQGSFDYEERVEMIRAGLELAHYYRFFDVNVTTDEEAAKDTGHYAWIVVTNDEGSGGWAKKGVLDYNPQPSGPRGVAGSDGVLGASTSRRGYLLAHEFGHMFGLEHNGIINGSGNFVEYSDWNGAESIGAIMGGRSSQFDGYRWRQLWTDEHDPQDSMAIIGALAGFVDDGGDCHTEPLYDSDYCTSGCPCDEGEGDCDNDSQCTGDLVCVQYSGTDYCEAPSSPPPSDCHTVPLYDSDYCTSDCPCDEGEGDCDNSSQCAGDLVCVQYSGTDYCEQQ